MVTGSERLDDQRAAASAGPATAMLGTVRALFPDAAVELTRSSRTAQHEFRFFPTVRWPHLVLPARPTGAAARTTWRFSVADGPVSSASRAAAAGVLATIGPRSRDRILVDGAADSVLTHLERVLGRPVVVSIGIGTARANRKPVLQVFDRRGRTLAFAKVGVDETSRAHVRGEAERMSRIGDRVPPGIVLPALLDASTWRGHEVLVMSALRTRPQRPGLRTRVPVDRMHAFSRGFGVGVALLQDSPFWRRHQMLLAGLAPGDLGDRLRQVSQQLAEAGDGLALETGGWHGDWTPWNMAWRGGTLQLWDLERFSPDGLVGLDLVHYMVNERMQSRGVSTESVLDACRAAVDASGLPAGHGELVAGCYLLAVALRYLGSGKEGGPSLARDRAELMTTAAERLVDPARRR